MNGDQPTITDDIVEKWHCPCGCGKEFSRHTGFLHYDAESLAAYRVALMQEVEGDPHLWVLLGSGPWFEDDERGCWLTLHSWLTPDGRLASRIEDPEDSPFSNEDAFEDRLLTRDEVFTQGGAAEWAFKCNDRSTHSVATTRSAGT